MNTGQGDGETKVIERISWEDSMLGDLKSFVVGIDNLKSEVVIGEHTQREGEVLGDWTCRLEVVLIFACVFQAQSDRGRILMCLCDPILRC